MLKGLSRILKSAAQVALPIALSATPLGPVFGAAAGSGIASLLAGAKPRDALLQAGLAGLGGAAYSKFAGAGAGQAQKVAGDLMFAENSPMAREAIQKAYQSGVQQAKPSFLQRLMAPTRDGKGPSMLTTALSVGLPSALAYMGAAQDARRAQPIDPKDYRSYVDDLYGGPVARPPEDRRITNLNPLSNLPTGKADGGMMGGIPSYSAMDGSDAGIMAMAEGGQTFPRKTGMINGPGGPKEDKIPAMLSDGEFVFTAKAVDNAGGPKAMYRMMNRLDPESERPNERA
jgi:hypothetical protein